MSEEDFKIKKESFVQFTQAVLKLVSNDIKSTNLPAETRYRTLFEENKPTIKVEQDYRYDIAFEYVYNETEYDSAIKRCIKLHAQDPFISKYAFRGQGERTKESDEFNLIHTLLFPIHEILRRAKTLDPNIETIEQVYDEWYHDISSEEQSFLLWIPLVNFQWDGGSIELTDNISITPFTDEDKNKALRQINTPYGMFEYIMPFRAFIHSQWKIEQRKTCGKEKLIIDPNTSDAEDLLTALRLTGRGSIGSNAYFYWRLGVHYMFSAGPLSDMEVGRFRMPYPYLPSKKEKLINVYNQIKSLQKQKRVFKGALKRYNQSYSRHTGEDRLLDITICLESSLLFGVKDELRYRIALRGARLLNNKIDNEATFYLLRTVYDARSAIVHEGKSLESLSKDGKLIEQLQKTRIKNIEKFLDQAAEDWARDILREYLSRMGRGLSLDAINKRLDDEAAGFKKEGSKDSSE